jgi:hypothetical protein
VIQEAHKQHNSQSSEESNLRVGFLLSLASIMLGISWKKMSQQSQGVKKVTHRKSAESYRQ